jgi:hypothetical protein
MPELFQVTSESLPCAVGDIKGNLNSMIYHMPWNRYYASTYANTLCFYPYEEGWAHIYGFRPARV